MKLHCFQARGAVGEGFRCGGHDHSGVWHSCPGSQTAAVRAHGHSVQHPHPHHRVRFFRHRQHGHDRLASGVVGELLRVQRRAKKRRQLAHVFFGLHDLRRHLGCHPRGRIFFKFIIFQLLPKFNCQRFV